MLENLLHDGCYFEQLTSINSVDSPKNAVGWASWLMLSSGCEAEAQDIKVLPSTMWLLSGRIHVQIWVPDFEICACLCCELPAWDSVNFLIFKMKKLITSDVTCWVYLLPVILVFHLGASLSPSGSTFVLALWDANHLSKHQKLAVIDLSIFPGLLHVTCWVPMLAQVQLWIHVCSSGLSALSCPQILRHRL